MRTNDFARIVDITLLGLLALLWGSSYLFIKVAVEDIPPLTLIASRVSIAALFLLCIVFYQKNKLPRDKVIWGKLFIQAIFNSIGAWTVLAWGQQYIDSGLASVLNSTAPIFVFFITFFFTRHESQSLLKLFGACLGVVGVVIIMGVDIFQGFMQQVNGQLAALTGAFLYACAAIYGKQFSHLPSTVAAAGTMLWAVVVLVPLSLALDRPWLLSPSTQSILAMMILGVFCTGIALLIYFRLLKTLGSMGVASQAYLRICVGVILGTVFLGEQITVTIQLGIVLALLGVVAINFPASRKKLKTLS